MLNSDDLEFATVQGSSLRFSVFDNKLLMLHGDFISAQWPLDSTGIQVTQQPGNVKIGFMSTVNETYQSFYFDLKEYERLADFFVSLGFKNSILTLPMVR